MTTFCTKKICDYILAHSPAKIQFWLLEGGFASDKKGSFRTLMSVRGRNVVVEAVLKRKVRSQYRLIRTDETREPGCGASAVDDARSNGKDTRDVRDEPPSRWTSLLASRSSARFNFTAFEGWNDVWQCRQRAGWYVDSYPSTNCRV